MDASAELQDFVRHVREALPDADTVHVVQNITTGRNAFIAGRDQHISLTLDSPPLDDDG